MGEIWSYFSSRSSWKNMSKKMYITYVRGFRMSGGFYSFPELHLLNWKIIQFWFHIKIFTYLFVYLNYFLKITPFEYTISCNICLCKSTTCLFRLSYVWQKCDNIYVLLLGFEKIHLFSIEELRTIFGMSYIIYPSAYPVILRSLLLIWSNRIGKDCTMWHSKSNSRWKRVKFYI